MYMFKAGVLDFGNRIGSHHAAGFAKIYGLPSRLAQDPSEEQE